MGTRIPAKPEELVAFLRRVEILDGALIRVTFASQNSKRQSHGLSRAYRGGIVVWTGDDTRGFTILDPAVLPSLGADPTSVFHIGTIGGAVYTGDVMVWVF